FRTTILLTAIVLAATGLTGATYLRISTQSLADEAQNHARDLARALATSTAADVIAQDQESLLGIAQESVDAGELNYVVFTDQTGRMLASFQRGAGSINRFIMNDARHISVEPLNRPSILIESQGPVVDIVYPVASISPSAGQEGLRHTAGYIRLGVSMRNSDARLQNLIRSVIGLAAGIALLMVPLGYQVVRHLVGPIEALSEAVREFAAGKLDTRVKIQRRDEVGELATAFNGMADELARSHNQLVKLNAELEDRVLRRTRDLEEANKLLRDMASRDSLTGLYNRRHFNDLLAQLFAESARYGTDLTCMMIDLDNFKRVNDTLGHQIGDQLLQATADVIRSSIRESDVAIRFGGDEFAVLLPQTSPADAGHSAERILRNFRQHLARHMPEANITSLSIGMVSRENDLPATASELVTLADEALYLAKAAGKNRITVACPAGASVKQMAGV
ncbi:MAG TPA: diguanylate cyclase, partial [Phycisphaerae bacterium]|nr:diguanylate cyclase [Phycisphaerae bacterium]